MGFGGEGRAGRVHKTGGVILSELQISNMQPPSAPAISISYEYQVLVHHAVAIVQLGARYTSSTQPECLRYVLYPTYISSSAMLGSEDDSTCERRRRRGQVVL